MICTEAEVRAVTGKKRRDAQQRALIAMGIKHLPRPDGSLVVARALVEHLLGVRANAKVAATTEPNWNALAPAS